MKNRVCCNVAKTRVCPENAHRRIHYQCGFFGNGYPFPMLAIRLIPKKGQERNGKEIHSISAKILRLMQKDGDFLCTNPPYGYRKDPDNPKQWIVDEEAAEVVHRIFSLCIEGYGPSQIARCADCGEKLYYCTSRNFEARQDHFVCSTSRLKQSGNLRRSASSTHKPSGVCSRSRQAQRAPGAGD